MEKTSEEPKKTFWVVDGHLLTAVWVFGNIFPKSTSIMVCRNPDASDFIDAVFFSLVEYNEENLLFLKQAGFEEVEPPVQR